MIGRETALVLTTVKNEGPYLLEWVAHHLSIGFDRFLIFSNDCDDLTDRILDRLAELVPLVHAPNPKSLFPGKGNWQVMAYRYGRYFNFYRDAGWIYFCDVDEFLWIKVGEGTLDDLFKATGPADVVSFTSMPYSSNGVKSLADMPVTAQFTQASKPYNQMRLDGAAEVLNAVKTLFRNDIDFDLRRNHRPRIAGFSKTGLRWIDGSGRDMPADYTDGTFKAADALSTTKYAQMNHYALRSAEAFLNKVHRGDVAGTDRLDHAMRYWEAYNGAGDPAPCNLAERTAYKAVAERFRNDDVLMELHKESVAIHQERARKLRGGDLSHKLGLGSQAPAVAGASGEDDAFVTQSVGHQLGCFGGARPSLSDAARAFALGASSGSTLAWNATAGAPFPANGWTIENDGSLRKDGRRTHSMKASATLDALISNGLDYNALIDMQDRRMRNLVTPEGEVHPVFCFNRLKDAPGRVLWPLPGYHDIDADDFLGNLDPAAIRWEEKKDVFAWRGILGGRSSPHADIRQEGKRLRPVLRHGLNGEVPKAKIKETLLTFPRIRFVGKYIDDGRADVGFVDGNGFTLKDEPLLKHLERPRLPRTELQTYKYLIVLRGLDVGSSFFWTMNSGSLGLVMDTPFETFASVHFRPWEHYVPFREDLTDFEERLEWCEGHQDECRAMAERAVEVCCVLARSDIRDRIGKEVVAHLRDKLSG